MSFTIDPPLSREHYEILHEVSRKFHEPIKGEPFISPMCDWQPSLDRTKLVWNQQRPDATISHYNWLQYLLKTYFRPFGYKLHGEYFYVEDGEGALIEIVDNMIRYAYCCESDDDSSSDDE